ncbi:putative toxin-antitoxin system toxin component, PIN family [Nostoc sp.]|uniref:putative toxin-antitoxin system toxin component, PIN family n=1 Tax=Nostoc sp. TaxID=1180 RepID=UPI002FFAF9B8
MRVILDVNVWISALLWGGVPGKILRLARNQQINIFASKFLLLELETTFKRF